MSACERVYNFEDRTSLVRRMIGWRGDGEEDAKAFQAATFVINALKNYNWNESVAALDFAIHNPDVFTKCVPVPQHLANLRVITCRLWRWPNLSHCRELKSIDQCLYSSLSPYFCINPYHYENVNQSVNVSPMHSLQQNPLLTSTDPNFVGGFQMQHQSGLASMNYSSENAVLNYSRRNQELVRPMQAATNSMAVNSGYSTNGTYESYFQESPSTINQSSSQSQETGWASVSYYEMNFRIGQLFVAKTSPIQIDGYMNPPASTCARLSIGSFSNPNRTSRIEDARKHVGDGLLLWHNEGEIFIKCLSKQSLYIQSASCNILNNFSVNEVVKLTSGKILKIFSDPSFAHMLKASVAGGYEAVFQLTKIAVTRISFVKGFGPSYTRRDITNTPCWIEIKFHKALMWIDKVLTQMKTPDTNISSVS